MKHRLFMVLFAMFSLILVLTSCSQPGMPDFLVGGVHLAVEGTCDEACLLLEQALASSSSMFLLSGSGPRGYSVNRSNTKLPWQVNRLPVGNWTLQFDIHDASGAVVLQGNAAVEVRPGSLDEVTLSLSLPTAGNQVANPVFTPTPGTIASNQSISLSCATSGALLYYTTDGSTPTSSSTRYTVPFTLTANTTIKALAVKSGMDNSHVTSASYVLQVASPTFSGSESSFTDQATVSLSCATEGASIHYTTDGSTPSSSSARYAAPLSITETTTVKAIAIKSGWDASPIVQASYTKQGAVSSPLIQTTAGTGGIMVSLSSATEGATIHYTTDGSTPVASSPAYTSAFLANQTMTVKAIAIKSGMTSSSVSSQQVAVEQVATPQLSPAGTVFSTSLDVSINCNTSASVIHYTLDGSAPSASSPTHTGQIHLTNSTVIKAIAVKSGMANSAVATSSYTLQTTISNPVFTPEPIASGFNSAQSVTISCPTEGATIHYTSALGDTIPSDPTAASPSYTGPITVSETTTIKAIATKDGCDDSAVITKRYAINGSIIIEF